MALFFVYQANTLYLHSSFVFVVNVMNICCSISDVCQRIKPEDVSHFCRCVKMLIIMIIVTDFVCIAPVIQEM